MQRILFFVAMATTPVHVQAFLLWDILVDLFCSTFSFWNFCQERTFRTVYLDVYRAFDEQETFLGTTEKNYVISPQRIHVQIANLNLWFKGEVTFRLGSIKDFDYELVQNESTIGPGENACFLLNEPKTNGYFNPQRISLIYAKELRARLQNGDWRVLNGCADIDRPLSTVPGQSPTTLLSTTSMPLGFIDPNTLSILAAHELGHIFGFRHTTTNRVGGQVYPYTRCGLNLRYPSFGPDGGNVVDVDGTIYNIDDWKGRTNFMVGTGNNYDSFLVDPLSIRFFGHGYREVFRSMVECWLERSSSP